MTTKEKKAWSAAAAIGTVMVVILSQIGETPEPPVRLNHMTKTQKDSVTYKEIRGAKNGDEIISMRTSTTRITKVEGNKFNAIISTTPQNYLDDADSVYKPIDLTVREISDLAKLNPLKKFDKYVNAGNFRATWKNGKPHDYTFHKGDYSLSYTSLFDTVTVPVTTEFSNVGVKQTYTFKDAHSVQDLKWLMSSNTIKQKQSDGSINFYGDDYSLQFIMPAPTAWDANHVFIPVTATISGDTLIYVMKIPEDVVFPVTVDPTTIISYYANYSTGRVAGLNVAYSKARDGGLNVDPTGQLGQLLGFYVLRPFMSFITSSIISDAVIDSAKVILNIGTKLTDTDFNINLVEATFPNSTSADTSWIGKFVGWAVQTSPYTITELGSAPSTASYATNDTVRIKLNATGLTKIAKGAGAQTKFALLSSRDVAGTQPSGNEYITSFAVAYLQVWYQVPPDAPTNFANTAATTTTLSYSWTDNSNDESGFKIKRAGGDTATVATSAANSVADTVEGLGINTRHGLRVFAFNAIGWSTPSDSVVKYTLANPPNAWNFTNVGATGTVDVGFGVNSNPAATTFAIRDSTSQQWVQTNGTISATIAWATYATWNAVTITQPGTTGTRFYAMLGRNGDSVLTAWLVGSLYVYKYPPPTSFSISNPDTTTLDVSWTLSGVHVDSLLIMNSPENTAVQYVSVAKTDTTVGGRTPNTPYIFFIRADSLGTKGDSNADTLYTLAVAPTTWNFLETSALVITPSFSGGSNPAGTLYALRDSLRHVWINASGVPTGTKTWRTEAQWEDTTLTGLLYDQQYLLGVVAKNGDAVETTYLWGSVTTAALTTTINAINAGGLVSIPQTSNYDMFQPSYAGYAYADSAGSYDGARNYITGEGSSTSSIVVGQRLQQTEIPIYTTYRGQAVFNTSDIPDGVVITGAKVKFKLTDRKTITTNDYLYLIKSSGFIGQPSDYYRRFTGWTETGPYNSIVKLSDGISVTGFTAPDSINIYFTLNAAGLAAINKTGNTEFVLITEKDRVGTAPAAADTTAYVILDPDYRYLQVYFDSYYYSRNVATGTVVDTLKVGQDSLSVSRDVIDRSFMTFPMPVGMTSVETATLNLYGYADSSVTDFYMYVVGANAYRPTLTTADFIRFNGRQSLNTPHTSIVLNDSTGASSASYIAGFMSITLNDAGIDSLEAASGDSLALALISKNDFSAIAPTGRENIMFNAKTANIPYLSLSYALTKPSNFTIDPETSTRLILTWTDNTDDNTSFRIIDPFTYAYIDSTTGIDAGDSTYKVITELTPNTLYRYRVQVVGGASDFTVSNADSAWTLSNIPGKMTLTLIDNTKIKFVTNTNSNPSYTKFAIQDSLTGKFVQIATGLCSLGTTIQWYTYSQLGSASGDTLGVNPGQYIVLRAKARNTDQ